MAAVPIIFFRRKTILRASIAIQIEPNCQDDYEAVRIVDAVIDYIRSTGLHCYVGPSETSIEGDDLHRGFIDILENCMQVAAKAGSAGLGLSGFQDVMSWCRSSRSMEVSLGPT